MSRSEFIREALLKGETSNKVIVEEGAKQGLEFSSTYVSQIKAKMKGKHEKNDEPSNIYLKIEQTLEGLIGLSKEIGDTKLQESLRGALRRTAVELV